VVAVKHLKYLLIGAVAAVVLIALGFAFVAALEWLADWPYSLPVVYSLLAVGFTYLLGGVIYASWPIVRGRR
jgi:uncharacterized membrane protein YfcA